MMIIGGEVILTCCKGYLYFWRGMQLTHYYYSHVGIIELMIVDRSHDHTKPHRYTQFLQLLSDRIHD